ncbi:hypothetical protein [Mesorhizobium sp. M1409]|uniref:hypothetical protein n=1 Tax=unclassified Mesorhizobium TaxID=325217 RepID=UPI003334BA87
MKDNIRHYMESAVTLDYIIPTVDTANGDMILVFKTEDANGGRSFRMYPERVRSFVPISP